MKSPKMAALRDWLVRRLFIAQGLWERNAVAPKTASRRACVAPLPGRSAPFVTVRVSKWHSTLERGNSTKGILTPSKTPLYMRAGARQCAYLNEIESIALVSYLLGY
jgi:hypothetical protein